MTETIAFSQTNGISIRSGFKKSGAVTVGLIHELGGCLNSFDDLVPLLDPTYSVLRADQRGMGLSEKVAGPYDLRTLAEDFVGLLDHYNIREPIVLLGAAVGASIATEVALTYPERVKALILAAPALFIPEERRAVGHDMANRLEEKGMRAIADIVLQRSFPEHLWNNSAQKNHVISRWLGADHRGYAATHRMLLELDLRHRLSDLSMPVLVLAGQHDPHAPKLFLEQVAADIPNHELLEISAGHFMCVQSPELVSASVHEFIASL